MILAYKKKSLVILTHERLWLGDLEFNKSIFLTAMISIYFSILIKKNLPYTRNGGSIDILELLAGSRIK